MTLNRRILNTFCITLIFLITNFLVHHNSLNNVNQSEVFETHIKSAVVIFIPATQINPFLHSASKSKNNYKDIHLFSLSTETLAYQLNQYFIEIEYLKKHFELKHSQKSSRAPPIA